MVITPSHRSFSSLSTDLRLKGIESVRSELAGVHANYRAFMAVVAHVSLALSHALRKSGMMTECLMLPILFVTAFPFRRQRYRSRRRSDEWRAEEDGTAC
jgi:lysylphosphatidylglycerol synthetase-like protein (DUF2156 family)